MRLAALAILLVWQSTPRVAPEPQHFRYQRAIAIPAGTSGPACITLDGTVYAHSPTLSDIRLYSGTQELPYAVFTSQAATVASDSARILNLGEQHGHIVFDLAMPARPYSNVDLNLTGQNFIATAKVASANSNPTDLGTFTLFDLTAQHLGRSTALPLVESTFPLLHIDLTVTPAPGRPGFKTTPAMVASASIPPSREAQTLYTTVAQTSDIHNDLHVQPHGQQTVVMLKLPAHIPVERISFDLDPNDNTNFSRHVEIFASLPEKQSRSKTEQIMDGASGEISRVQLTNGGNQIREESLSIPATLGANARGDSWVTIEIENGDDRPIPLRAVRLEMRQRTLCFDAPSSAVAMFYGDDALRSPNYDYLRLFQPSAASTTAQLQPEQPNPLFIPRAIRRSFTRRHPELLWAAILAVAAILVAIACRSTKHVH